jgi:hypothetical protein
LADAKKILQNLQEHHRGATLTIPQNTISRLRLGKALSNAQSIPAKETP